MSRDDTGMVISGSGRPFGRKFRASIDLSCVTSVVRICTSVVLLTAAERP